MKTGTRRGSVLGALAASGALALSSGCKSGGGEIAPEPAGLAAAGAGGGTKGGDGGDAGRVNQPKACPAGLPGPELVLLRTPKGAAYCIDATEVRQKHYAAFLADNAGKAPRQDGFCSDNRTYVPEPQTDTYPEGCVEGEYAPETRGDEAMGCVGWCDAKAFCAWAGKRLCGKVGGGTGTLSTMTDAEASEWYNACSAGGKLRFPYGNEYDPDRCIGKDAVTVREVVVGSGYDQSVRQDYEVKNEAALACHGDEPPYSEIVDLSGSLWEFTNECDLPEYPFRCGIRGGNMADAEEQLACDVVGTRDVPGQSSGVGIRCCADAVAEK